MKEHIPSPSSWMGYITIVKEYMSRELTESDYKVLMKGYINSVDVKTIVNQLE